METSPPTERSHTPHLGPMPSAHVMGRVRNLSKARGKILELLSHGPCTVSSIALRTGQHENTIREHLDALVDVDLAIKYQAAEHLRGRPAWLYRTSDTSNIGEYAGLASALAGAIVRGSSNPAHEAMEAGIAWAPELIRNSKVVSDPRLNRANKKNAVAMRRKVVSLLEKLGFAPKPNADIIRIKLTRCPLLEAARQHPNVICNVHLGIVRGALKEFGAEPKSIDKVTLDPFSEPGACLLRM